MITKAAWAGAWSCKIQTFFAEDLSYKWRANKPADFERLKDSELSWGAHKRFVDRCKDYDLVPMTSIYTTRYLDRLWKLGFRFIKIGSAQAGDEELVRATLKKGFRVIISLGGRHQIPEYLRASNADWHFSNDEDGLTLFNPPFAILHCVSEYPHDHTSANLSRMRVLFNECQYAVAGYSDHSPDVYSAKAAAYFGAAFIEKHVRLGAPDETKDGPVSISFDQLKEIADFIQLDSYDQWKREPELGVWKAPISDTSVELINDYAERWNR